MKGHAPLWLLGEIHEVIRPNRQKNFPKFQNKCVNPPIIYHRRTIEFKHKTEPKPLYLLSKPINMDRKKSLKLPKILPTPIERPKHRQCTARVIKPTVEKPEETPRRPNLSMDIFDADQWEVFDDSSYKDLEEYVKVNCSD